MSLRQFAILLFATLMTSAASAAYDIAADLVRPAFWKSHPVSYVREHLRDRFDFTSVTRESATCLSADTVTFAGLKVYETRVFFLSPTGGIARVEISLYNKGDATGKSGRGATIDREAFARLIKAARAALAHEGVKPSEPRKEPLRDPGFIQMSQKWPRNALGTTATLTWNCYQRGGDTRSFRAEFARLVVTGPEASDKVRTKRVSDIRKNIRKDSASGDVYLMNVPMVDQGQKGYCAAATSERVMRYYGLTIDEHEIAQAAGTSAQSGTSVESMCASITKVAAKFRMMKTDVFGVGKPSVSWEKSDQFKTLQAYNMVARKMKKNMITQKMFTRGNVIDIPAMERAMDPVVLREAKTSKMAGRYRRFRDAVKHSVLMGQPLFWGVTLGIFPEPDIPQANGGHMRLIIGFNEKKGEILYSDSWGAGHELKRMPMDNAWTITQTLFYLSAPR